MANIFIIGNGFDVAHGLNSSYEYFYKYLSQTYGDVSHSRWVLPYIFRESKECDDIDAAHFLMRLISAIDKSGTRWCDFENSLGKLDYSRFFETDYMDTYTDALKRSLEISVPKIKKFFNNWIMDMRTNEICKIDSFSRLIDIENDYFISFNYTHVLEDVYNAKHVCHVHGDFKSDIIMGHGDHSIIKLMSYPDLKTSVPKGKNSNQNEKLFRMEKYWSNISVSYLTIPEIKRAMTLLSESSGVRLKKGQIQFNLYWNLHRLHEIMFRKKRNITSYNSEYDNNDGHFVNTDLRIQLIENVVQKIHRSLMKDTSSAMVNLMGFIGSISNVRYIDNIYSIGFSYSDIDMKIVQIVSLLKAKTWYLNNYKSDDINVFARKIKNCSFEGKISKFDFTKAIEKV